MSLKEEQEKYLKIKEKLDLYRESLEEEGIKLRRIPDHDLAVTLYNLNERRKYQYDKNKTRPYFAKIMFTKDGDKNATTAYIGRIGFASLDDEDIIIDWRAPISDLYYNSKLGKASFKIGKEEVSGELSLKRQINFDDGQITQVYDLDNSISSDEFLQPYLSSSADNRLKNIIATIQKEQDDIIRMPFGDNLIIQGVAGSGKTTVALHRLSYLIYNNKDYYKPDSYIVISPNAIFKSYISTLLEELDADQVESTNMEEIIENILKNDIKLLSKHEKYYKLIDNGIKADYLKFKGSKEFASLIEKFLENYAKEMFYKDFVIKGACVLSKEFVYKTFLESKRETLEDQIQIWAGKLDSYVKNNDKLEDYLRDLSREGKLSFNDKIFIERTLERSIKGLLLKFYKKRNILEIYKKFISSIDKLTDYKDKNILKKSTLADLNKNIIAYDDIGAILYLASRISSDFTQTHLRQVIIDEAQDFSYLTFLALKRIYQNAYFSIFGDIAQGIYSYQSIDSWQEIIPLFENVSYLELNKSYRTTIEITESANKILKGLGFNSASNVLRHGYPVEERLTENIEEAIKKEIDDFKSLNFVSSAVICKDEKELKKAREILKDLVKSYSENDTDIDNNYTSLLTLEASKGLEFDYVIIYDKNSYSSSPLDQRRFYVACTRALHKLVINRIINK